MFMVITLLLCVCVRLSIIYRKVSVSVHVFPGDAFKSTVQLHVCVWSTWVSTCAGLEQFIRVDVWYGLSPVTERAVLRQDKGLVLLFTQQGEHMLHQLAETAVTEVRHRDG